MARFSSDGRCERARVWASLELDGELSEFERALLAAHLGGCEACAGFVGELGALTEVLRAGPLEELERPFLLPARKRVVRNRRLVAQVALAASLAGLAVGLGLLAGPLIGRSDEPAPPAEDVVLVTPTSANQLSRESNLRGHGETKREDRLFPSARIRENL